MANVDNAVPNILELIYPIKSSDTEKLYTVFVSKVGEEWRNFRVDPEADPWDMDQLVLAAIIGTIQKICESIHLCFKAC